MTWITTVSPETKPEIGEIRKKLLALYPSEYSPERESELRVPDAIRDESVIRTHSLIPEAMYHAFATHAALLDPRLPLERRHHELIAAVVSATNRCFY